MSFLEVYSKWYSEFKELNRAHLQHYLLIKYILINNIARVVICKELTSHPAGVARLVSRPNTSNTAGLQAMYHSLSADHIPWLFQAPYTTVCPKNACHSLSKDQILQLVHRLPTMACLKTTYHGLSKDHTPWLVHRLPSMACPKTT